MTEDTTIFRAKVEPVTETPVSLSEPRKTDEPTIATFEHTEKPPSLQEKPYINKMFELGEAATHFEMPTLLKEINEFVLSKGDDIKTYEEVVNSYLKKLHLPSDIDVYTKTEKIHELMMIDKKLIDAAKEKEELLAKPIEELTSKQLKARIEGKL
mgnify:CR=1 FL=1